MATVEKFEDLLIWKESKKLTIEIYGYFNTIKDFGFRDQIQRSSVSVMNNIAEGFERESDTEFKRFLVIAKSSCGELRSMLHLAENLGYISNEQTKELLIKCRKLSGSIAKLIKYLKG